MLFCECACVLCCGDAIKGGLLYWRCAAESFIARPQSLLILISSNTLTTRITRGSMLYKCGPGNMALAAFRIKKFNVPAGGGRCTYIDIVCRALLLLPARPAFAA
jgi:hypothetical protein